MKVELTKELEQESELRFLVVEDEAILAMYVEDLLVRLNCAVVKAGRVGKALKLLQGNRFDGAFLDVNISGTPVFPLAQVLRSRKVPFAFITGSDADRLPAEYKDTPVLAKPLVELQFAALVATFSEHARNRRECEATCSDPLKGIALNDA